MFWHCINAKKKLQKSMRLLCQNKDFSYPLTPINIDTNMPPCSFKSVEQWLGNFFETASESFNYRLVIMRSLFMFCLCYF